MNTSTELDVIVAGCGYAGRLLAQRISASGTRTVGLSRRVQTEFQNFSHLQIDLDNLHCASEINCAGKVVYYLVPPPKSGSVDTRLGNFLDSIATGVPAKFILISTTGVYGNCDGQWVSEESPLNPQADRSIRRVDAEQKSIQWCVSKNIDLTILRVAAIYGPGRIPVERIKKGITLPTPESCGFSNRIHVNDLVSVCMAAANPTPSMIYNVSDGFPMPMTKYYMLVAEIWNLPPPQISDFQTSLASHSRSMQSYLTESRKIDNRRMMQELNIELAFPDARKGLEYCYKVESGLHNAPGVS